MAASSRPTTPPTTCWDAPSAWACGSTTRAFPPSKKKPGSQSCRVFLPVCRLRRAAADRCSLLQNHARAGHDFERVENVLDGLRIVDALADLPDRQALAARQALQCRNDMGGDIIFTADGM